MLPLTLLVPLPAATGAATAAAPAGTLIGWTVGGGWGMTAWRHGWRWRLRWWRWQRRKWRRRWQERCWWGRRRRSAAAAMVGGGGGARRAPPAGRAGRRRPCTHAARAVAWLPQRPLRPYGRLLDHGWVLRKSTKMEREGASRPPPMTQPPPFLGGQTARADGSSLHTPFPSSFTPRRSVTPPKSRPRLPPARTPPSPAPTSSHRCGSSQLACHGGNEPDSGVDDAVGDAQTTRGARAAA